jgi:hypothetical protein
MVHTEGLTWYLTLEALNRFIFMFKFLRFVCYLKFGFLVALYIEPHNNDNKWEQQEYPPHIQIFLSVKNISSKIPQYYTKKKINLTK